MKGIQYVIDEKGHKTGVFIDFKQYGEIWEDIYDTIIAKIRKNEPRVSWSKIRESS